MSEMLTAKDLVQQMHVTTKQAKSLLSEYPSHAIQDAMDVVYGRPIYDNKEKARYFVATLKRNFVTADETFKKQECIKSRLSDDEYELYYLMRGKGVGAGSFIKMLQEHCLESIRMSFEAVSKKKRVKRFGFEVLRHLERNRVV